MEKETPRAVNIPWPYLGVFSYCVDGPIELGKLGVCDRSPSLSIPPGFRLYLGNIHRMDFYVPYLAIFVLASAQGIRLIFFWSIH